MIKDAELLFELNGFRLPPFAYLMPSEWLTKSASYSELRHNGLGWMCTDFGADHGAVIRFILRRGDPEAEKYRKPYSEEIFMCRKGTSVPPHCHLSRMQDIVNRGGGVLTVRILGTRKGMENVTLRKDGFTFTVHQYGLVKLCEGESLTIPAGCIHEICADGDDVAVSEISTFMCITSDDYFTVRKPARSLKLEEDEPPYRLLISDYKNLSACIRKTVSDDKI